VLAIVCSEVVGGYYVLAIVSTLLAIVV
jgi:hypothetical protein